jgi:Queuine tRNA-ribosyltransferase
LTAQRLPRFPALAHTTRDAPLSRATAATVSVPRHLKLRTGLSVPTLSGPSTRAPGRAARTAAPACRGTPDRSRRPLRRPDRAGAQRGRGHSRPAAARGPVASRAPARRGPAVRTLEPRDVQALGYEIVLGNTFHLFIRPCHELIAELGGLHAFMRWPGPIVTDSGGFQVFSMGHGTVANEVKGRSAHGAGRAGAVLSIEEEGVEFRSYVDGSKRFMGPETSMEIHAALGSDIALVFDECTPFHLDTFDCAMPTRLARHGMAVVPEPESRWRVDLTAAPWRRSTEPILDGCHCPACTARYPRGYLNHLLRLGEATAGRLLTLHNLHFVARLMDELREAIGAGTLAHRAAALRAVDSAGGAVAKPARHSPSAGGDSPTGGLDSGDLAICSRFAIARMVPCVTRALAAISRVERPRRIARAMARWWVASASRT